MYDIGDKVVIRDDLVIEDKYNNVCFTKGMEEYKGSVVTIIHRYGSGRDKYLILEDGECDNSGSRYIWSVDMINHEQTRVLMYGNIEQSIGGYELFNYYLYDENKNDKFITSSGAIIECDHYKVKENGEDITERYTARGLGGIIIKPYGEVVDINNRMINTSNEAKHVVEATLDMVFEQANRFEEYEVTYTYNGRNSVTFNTLVDIGKGKAVFNGKEGFAVIPLEWIISMVQISGK